MGKEVMRSIENIGIYPTISFVLFTLFFTGILIMVLKAKKTHISAMKALPLEDSHSCLTTKTEES